MKRYKCVISYDGTFFYGYQVQPNKRTVQGELESALAKMHKVSNVRVTASGRTDTKVHAKGQVVHFDSPLNISPENWRRALNRLLPEDISIVEVDVVDNTFHARFDAVRKEYRYFIRLSDSKDPFTRFYQYRYPYEIKISEMERASKYLIGTHDFTSFCSAKTDIEDKVRTIEQITFNKEDELLIISFVGTGFLYNMVRILVGTLLEVGSGRRTSQSIKETLLKKDRTTAGKTAPPQGLYLWNVFYK